VATNGGVSVIKDNGTVVDITMSSSTYSESNDVTLSEEGTVTLAYNNANGSQYGWVYTLNIPSSDTVITVNAQSPAVSWFDTRYEMAFNQDLWISNTGGAAGVKLSAMAAQFPKLALGTSSALTNTVDNLGTEPYLFNYTTSSYNTGWMNGDIKLATLSDADDTDITFADKQLIDEPYFNASTGWYFNGSGASGAGSTTGSGWSISGGKITQSGSGGDFYAVIPVVNGRQYIMQLTFDTTGTSSFNNVSWGFRSLANSGYLSPVQNQTSLVGNTANQTKNVFWTANTTGNIIARVYCDAALSIDNFTVHIAEEDRSVNGNGLQVFGTVTKSKGGSDRDIVSYGGFDSGDYLQQPYNSSLDFSGDFCIQTWMYIPSDTTAAAYHYGYTLDQDQAILALYVAGQGLRTYTRESGGNWNYIQSSVVLNSWIHVTHQRKSGIVSTSINGILTAGSYTHTANLTRSGNVITLGRRIETTQTTTYWRGSLSLFRLSNTALSQEQIKKIYNDEKFLFQENAKATLYGSSDAVTALAYDDDTELLHVGTSAGRSVFQGLRRIDNTTDAVGAAISASNGMVAED
jgi:hypothetical protein